MDPDSAWIIFAIDATQSSMEGEVFLCYCLMRLGVDGQACLHLTCIRLMAIFENDLIELTGN